MENIQRVTEHQRRKLAAGPSGRRALTCVAAADGQPSWCDAEGNTWRTYTFIENARSYRRGPVDPAGVRRGRARSATSRRCWPTCPTATARDHSHFHNTPWRLATLEAAIAADAHGRAQGCRAEIDYALAQRAGAQLLISLQAAGRIPERITHNDTKLNNVMLDETTGEDVCVSRSRHRDRGTHLYDFGDMVAPPRCRWRRTSGTCRRWSCSGRCSRP